MQCDLARVRPPVSRELRMIKRTTQVVEKIDPPPKTWWEACVWGSLQRDCFQLVDNAHEPRRRRARRSGTCSRCRPAGACAPPDCSSSTSPPELRRRGYASYLLGEAIRILRRRGVATIEAQTMATNEAATAFYAKFGFTEIDHGVVFRKDAADVTLTDQARQDDRIDQAEDAARASRHYARKLSSIL